MLNKWRPIQTIAILLLLFGVFITLNWFFGENEEETIVFYLDGEYAFDAKTILGSLRNGDINVFESPTVPFDEIFNQQTAKWNHSDFLMVAEGFHQYFWSENFQAWQFDVIDYAYDCRAIDRGPNYAYYSLSRVGQGHTGRSRLIHSMWIYLGQMRISWAEAEQYPILSKWRSINTKRMQIPPETILEIAEQHGGLEAREATKNNCEITLHITPYRDWIVRYSTLAYDGEPLPFIKLEINAVNGDLVHTETR